VQTCQRHDYTWGVVVSRVAEGDETAGAILYDRLAPIRRYFSVQLTAEDSEDRFHDVFVAVLRAVTLGGLHDPDRVLAYAWSTAKRMKNMRLGAVMSEREYSSNEDAECVRDDAPDPEAAAIRRENRKIAAQILSKMPERHRELLVRYYLLAQPREFIQEEMGLTANQFRLIKSKAKAALTTRMQHRLRLGRDSAS
jgi:RNA polymerase sigma factor (sigma-70 family)